MAQCQADTLAAGSAPAKNSTHRCRSDGEAYAFFMPDRRSAIMGNSRTHQPEHEAAGLFLTDLGSPADSGTIGGQEDMIEDVAHDLIKRHREEAAKQTV